VQLECAPAGGHVQLDLDVAAEAIPPRIDLEL
jgi:hypothetical protein